MTREGATRLGLGLLCFVYAALRFVAWYPTPLGPGVDAGWRILLHEAWHRGWVYGEDFIFTHGPYGFVYANIFYPETYHLSVALQVTFAAVIVAAVWRIAATVARRALVVAALTLVTLESMAMPYEGFYYNAIFLILLLHGYPKKDLRGTRATGAPKRFAAPAALLHLLVVAASMAALVKFSFFVALAVVMTSVSIDMVLRQRRPPWLLFTCLASLFALWLFASQPLRTFPLFLSLSMQIAGGYGAAMSLPGPWQEPALFAGTAALLIALYAMLMRARIGRWAFLPVATLAALLFVCAKGAYTRHDGHATIALSSLAPLVVLIAGWGWSQRRGAGLRALALATVVAMLSLFGVTLTQERGGLQPLMQDHYRISKAPRQLSTLAALLTGQFDVDREWDRATERIRKAFPIEKRRGTFDIYPFAQGIVVAHGFPHRPRPVFQSYKAYSPQLLKRNAAHLSAADGPRNVIFSIAPMDGKYPTLDDSLSLPILLSHFRLVEVESPFAFFRRTPQARNQLLEPLSSQRGRIGQMMPLPEAGAGCSVWAEIDLRPSLLGRGMTLAYKIPEAYLAVQDGTSIARYRFVPDIAREGFLLSPVLTNVEDLAALARGQFAKLQDREVRHLAIEVPGDPGLLFYAENFDIRFYCLRFEK